MSASAAVIDIGSNSIKALVADRAPDGSLRAVAEKTIEARISAGISRADPRLTDESMDRGLAAIKDLLAFAAPFSPARTVLVATSAVRDARNGADFRQRVRDETGQRIRLLSGDDEAALIGRGLACDPALRGVSDFYNFDLGGGSLECLALHQRRVECAISLQLGCVRLAEQFISDRAAPAPASELDAIARHTKAALASSSFAFSLPPATAAAATGGTITTVRAILAARARRPIGETDPRIDREQLRDLLDELARLPLDQRQKIPGLSPQRADVFPAALAILIAIAEAGDFAAYHHSFYNLRFGLADEALS
jgi:exopolyphosphatase/guanosine-5'-triphosphate,3'-diphosphate pyrophosphatase